MNGRPAQFAYYLDCDTRKPVAAKVRFSDKTFSFIGNPKLAPLYGQWLWRDGGKMVVVTEGEIDSLSVSQLQNNKWATVSVPTGAQGAAKSIRKALEWLLKFDHVVFMFDNDEPGRAAAVECAKLLPPGRAKIASLPLKDPNDMLVAGRGSEVIDAIWGAKEYRPDGIISVEDIWDSLTTEEDTPSVPYPWQRLTEKTSGIRKRELVTITAGSGIGKSLVCRTIAHQLISKENWRIGYIGLEENPKRTVLGIAGIGIGVPLHIRSSGVERNVLTAELEGLKDNLFLYDSFGSVDPDNLLERLRYLAVGLQCDALILDHISIAISGLEDIDERRALDVMMTKLRSLVEETGVALIVVSHVRRAQGDKGYEQGQMLSLSSLRGSAAISQLSDMVIGLERNQQADNSNETIVRVLKNRFTGDTGEAGVLYYNRDTGCLQEQPFKEVADHDAPF
jgi:twinkle protein